MIVFPNAKINLGLFITARRSDGYHNLETIFIPVKGFYDILEVLPNTESGQDNFTISGLQIDGTPENNLCLKALHLMRQRAHIPPLNIHLHKVIPFGAGLGGGSADAAFMLTLLNGLCQVGLSFEVLEAMAAQIGADCAVFIRNQPVLAKGIGNIFEPVNINLKGLFLLLIVPPIHVPTALAYQKVVPKLPETELARLVQNPIQMWKDTIVNDFEASVFPKYPKIEALKQMLYDQGALYASMSGSGSAVYGIFDHQPEIVQGRDYRVHLGAL